MEKKKGNKFKIFITILFAILVFGAFFYYFFGKFDANSKIEAKYFLFGSVALCFLMSLLFVKLSSKKILITFALLMHVVGDYFLILQPSEENKMFGLLCFCGAQAFYMIYTLTLNKGNGIRVLNLASRVALCLIAYTVLPQFIVLSNIQLVAVMYLINFIITIFVVLCHCKKDFVLLVGLLLFLVCDIFIGLKNGGIGILKLTGGVVDFISKYPLSTYFYVPSVFLIATASVWAKPKEKE